MRVLYIEDSDDDRAVMVDGLDAYEVACETAPDGTSGLARAATPFDVILVDLRLPDMPGIEVVRQLRARGDRRPIVAVSGFATPEEWAEAQAAGCQRYHAKPIDFDHLYDTLKVLTQSGEWLLLIEDDPGLAQRMQESLDKQFTLVWAKTGLEAMERLKEARQPFAAILVDLCLPEGLSGRELLGVFRKLLPTALTNTVIIGYAAALKPEGVEGERPYDAYLQLPFDPRGLNDQLRTWIDQRQQRV